MGKTKIKTIDYSREEVKEKASKKTKTAKSEPVEAIGEVEQISESVIASEAKQSSSEKIPTQIASSPTPPRNDKKRKPQKPGKAKPRSKKYQEKAGLVDPTQKYPLEEAVKLAQSASYSKFEGALEAHINTAVKNIRGLVSLPHFSGRALTILAFGPSTSLRVNKEAPEFEGITWGDDETISEIEKGPSASSGLKFDVLVTTPEWMPKLAKAAKILGPKGLMPNPKNGTITENLAKTITDLKGGKIEYKTEANGQVIHLSVGKTTQAPKEVAANVKVLYQAIGKSKVKKITLSPTMGPGVKVNLSSI